MFSLANDSGGFVLGIRPLSAVIAAHEWASQER
jgi:hypothetical protein